MTYKLNDKLKNINSYQITPEDYTIKLDANESFIDPGSIFKEKLLMALGDISLNRYPDDSYSQLKKAAGAYYDVDPGLLIVGNGSDELLSIIIGSLLKYDDILIMAEPDFSMYKVFASNFERKTVSLRRKEDGSLDYEVALKIIAEQNAAAILFSNPSAFYSTVATSKELLEFIDNTDALVIVDEAYMDFSNQSVIREVENRDNLIVLRTCSKALGCAGIRLGFAAASGKLAGVMNALRPPYNINALTAEAGRIVLSEKVYITNAVAEIIENRDLLHEMLIPSSTYPVINNIYPSATNFICIETEYADRIYQELKKRSILVRNLKTMLRITVGTKEENLSLAGAMKEIVGDIKRLKKRGDH